MEYNPENYTIGIESLYSYIGLYRGYGFKYIDVPYVVEDEVDDVTRPEEANRIRHCSFSYSGSGEQGFLQLSKMGLLGDGDYQTVSICIRDEAQHSDSTFLAFLKLELYSNKMDPKVMAQMVRDSLPFETTIIETVDGYDIISSDGVELGSYGKRINPFTNKEYTYGTGFSAPRTTKAMRNKL